MAPDVALLLAMFGLLAETLGGLLGIGGCVIVLLALCFLSNYPLPEAIGTTITAVIVTASSGTVAHVRIKNVDYDTARMVAFSGALEA